MLLLEFVDRLLGGELEARGRLAPYLDYISDDVFLAPSSP